MPEAIAAAIVGELDALSAAGAPPRRRRRRSPATRSSSTSRSPTAGDGRGRTRCAALDELLSGHDLVRPDDVPRRFHFRHPLVRRAVYEACPPGARLRRARRSADALAARGAAGRGARPPRRARRAARRPGGRRGAARGRARRRRERAPVSAARWFAIALGLLPDDAPPAERVELLLALARAHAATGRFEDSRAALLESIALTPGDDDGAARLALVGACAGLEQLLGHHEAARTRLTAALARGPARASPQAVALMIQLAVGDFYRMDYEAMRAWGVRALAAARTLRRCRSLTAASTAVLAVAAAFLGAVPEARRHSSDGGRARRRACPTTSSACAWTRSPTSRPPSSTCTATRAAGGTRSAAWRSRRCDRPGRDLPGPRPGAQQRPARHRAGGGLGRAARRRRRGRAPVGQRPGAGLEPAQPRVHGGRGRRPADRARRRPGERSRSRATSTTRLVSTYASVALASALYEERRGRARDRGPPGRAPAARSCRRIAGGWRANYFELLTRCWLAVGDAGAAARRGRAAPRRPRRSSGLPLRPAMAHRAAAAVALRGRAGDRRRAGAGLGGGGRRRRARGSRPPVRGRSRAGRWRRGGERARAVAELERAVQQLDAVRGGPLPPRGRARAAPPRAAGAPAHAAGQPRRHRARDPHPARGRGRAPRRRPPDEPRDRHGALPQRQDGRDAPAHIFRKLDVPSRYELARVIEHAEHGG